jgi:magnesium chelatase family protein
MLLADVYSLANLRDVAGDGGGGIAVQRALEPVGTASPCTLDLADVRGQWQAKRALVIAAAGGHSLLMVGPPGSGKSMLAQRLAGLMPPLSRDEVLEVAAIAAVAQCNAGVMEVVTGMQRPFRSPHHTASAHAIVGGGSTVQPGEVSLAHHGVLFLDELPEFDRRVLESLREPLESGRVSVVRTSQRIEFPAQFQLIAAMNPCKCGRAGASRCTCSPTQVAAYRARISGPLLDRIDLQLELAPVAAAELTEPADAGAARGFTSAAVRQQVCMARGRALGRQGKVNARLDPAETLQHCQPGRAGRALLQRAAAECGYSARGQHRVLRVARSIADLAERDEVCVADVAEALALRCTADLP